MSPLIVIGSIAELRALGDPDDPGQPANVAAALEWVRRGVLHADVTRCCGPAPAEWTRGDSNP